MKCPKCSSQLSTKIYRGIEVDQCNSCKGMWLDYDELDQLEDQAFDIDELKGSLIVSDEETKYACPHCSSPLRKFQYRLNDLQLDYCQNKHGFWLDADEEKRVLQIMKQREKDMKRKFKAEAEWDKTLKRLRSKSFKSKLSDLFK
jgi:Zn-finger nucleic acid-binding protein